MRGLCDVELRQRGRWDTRREAVQEAQVGAHEGHVEVMGQRRIEGVVEGQASLRGQTDGGQHQLNRWGNEIKFQFIQLLDTPRDVTRRKDGVVEEGIGDFVHQQVRCDQPESPLTVGLKQRSRMNAIRLLKEPLHGDRGVNDVHESALTQLPEDVDGIPAGGGFSTQTANGLNGFGDFLPVPDAISHQMFDYLLHRQASMDFPSITHSAVGGNVAGIPGTGDCHGRPLDA